MPKWVAGQEIKHSVLSEGGPVRAADEAETAGLNGQYFGLEVDGHRVAGRVAPTWRVSRST